MSETTPQHEVTRLIQAAGASDRAAAEQLLTLVYEQLRRIAQQRMSEERAGHTLQATALVHEAYLRLVGDTDVQWQGPAHFFAAAAETMRRILIEHARGRGRQKRGGAARRLPLSVVDLTVSADSDEILSLDEAICRMES
jgi:RNA polymerase sigma factor (TIGR02999 family)